MPGTNHDAYMWVSWNGVYVGIDMQMRACVYIYVHAYMYIYAAHVRMYILVYVYTARGDQSTYIHVEI